MTANIRRVLVVADDLIWADRLARLLAEAVIVDLTARNYDPIAAVERSAKAGRRVLAVGQHDDLALRKRALAAGAERVFAYRKMHEEGAAVLRAWIERSARPVEAGA